MHLIQVTCIQLDQRISCQLYCNLQTFQYRNSRAPRQCRKSIAHGESQLSNRQHADHQPNLMQPKPGDQTISPQVAQSKPLENDFAGDQAATQQTCESNTDIAHTIAHEKTGSRTKRKRGSKADQLPSLQDAPGLPEKLGDQPLRLVIVGHNPSDHAWWVISAAALI